MGFTVVEVMIVLAVTSALLVSGMLLVSGQQARTEFNQSTHDIEQQIDDVINNVATGYYANIGSFSCSVVGTNQPSIGPGPNKEGTNTGCIFIGRAIQFDPDSKLSQFNIYNLVGRQYSPINPTLQTSSLSDAKPIAIAKNDYTSPPITIDEDATENKSLGFGLQVVKMKYVDMTNTTNITGVMAFITDFPNQTSSTFSTSSQSRIASLYIVDTTSFTPPQNTKDYAVNAIDGKPDTPPITNYFIPAKKVSICFNGGTDKYGIITIGANSQQLNTDLRIVNTNPVPPECS